MTTPSLIPSPSSSSSCPPSVSLVDLLSTLDAYASTHIKADADVRACWWNLNKARRQKGGFHLGGGCEVYSARDVREELRARAVLTTSLEREKDGGDNEEDETASSSLMPPDLISEGEGIATEKEKQTKEGQSLMAMTVYDKGEREDVFALHLDGVPKNKAGDHGDQTSSGGNALASQNDLIVDAPTETTGLRHRKNKPTPAVSSDSKGAAAADEWTEEIPVRPNDNGEEDEDERLRKMDPINLFGGLPPPALRIAQTKAREALVSYVEAANLVAEIIQMTNQKT